MRFGTNLPAIGGFNQSVVLDVIRRSGDGLSRVELAERTGLSAQTVSNVCRRLLAAGLVREAGTTVGGVGKPRTIVQLEARGRFAIGVHLDPAVITFVLLDLSGAVAAHSRIPAPAPSEAAVNSTATIDRITESVEDLIASAGVDRSRVLGIGVASPGPVDVRRGVVLNPPLLSGWESVPLRDTLAERLLLPVLLEKDVTAAAVAEVWMGPDDQRRNFAFFYYGTGMGVGLVVQHEIIRGSTNNAGDAGHIQVGSDAPLCTCGRRGCLGNSVLPRLLVEEAVRLGALPKGTDVSSSAAVQAAFGDLAESAAAGDAVAEPILGRAAAAIATGLVSIINLLDLDRVVFGGPFWNPVSGFMLDRVPGLVTGSPALVPPHPIAFEASAIGEDVAAIGAACLVLDNAYSPHPAALLISALPD